ncbi:MAG: RluA family pseudouridine synthase [candidate division WOR-3 bacterium]
MLKEFRRVVSEKMAGKRLDHYLILSGIGISRNRVCKLIECGQILVNGKRTKPSYLVKARDEIVAQFEVENELQITPEKIPLDIVYEDSDVIIINKPAGMVIHPARGHSSGTLVQGLLYHCRHLPEHPESKVRPGVIHRLDKDTTGLLVFAKTDDALSKLGVALENRQINREYLAVAWGDFPQDSGTIEAPIGRHSIDRKKMAVTPLGAKMAITNFIVLERYRIATYLKLKLLTGRTHQIRVHLLHYGHPVVGDPDYGGRSKAVLKNKEDLKHFENILKIINRQALHAYKLGFHHPTLNKYVEFTAPLPEDMEKLLEYLRGIKK